MGTKVIEREIKTTKMTKEEKSAVGVNNTSKLTTMKVELDDITCHLVTSNPAPCAAICTILPSDCFTFEATIIIMIRIIRNGK